MGKKVSRSEYVVKNVTIAVLMQLVKNVLGFVVRTVFVYVLGAEYLGVNGLFTEILTMLSFAELGIGNAMVFSLYKPLAENNQKKIQSLMQLYAKTYKIIGLVIAGLGICVIPFLNLIVGDVSYVKENIILLYVLFLFNSVISYFFVYKKSLIIADQKNYIVDIYQQVFYAIQVVLQLFFLIVTKEFILFLVIHILITVLNNVFVARKADKMYPILKDKNVQPLDQTEKKSIFQNIKALVVYKIGGIILESTDSIFISSLINVVTVGLYSNYKMIINVFKTVGAQMMNSVIASVGNMNAQSEAKKKEHVFNEMLFISAWFFGFTSAGLVLLLSPLVSIWLGNDYIIDVSSVIAAVVYYYISNMHYPCFAYRTTAGLFIYGKFVPLFAAIINILLDIVLGINMGLTGILWASTIARVVTYEIVDPYLIYKKVFGKKVGQYFINYMAYACLVLLLTLTCYFVISNIPLFGLVGLLVKMLVILVLFNVGFALCTMWTESFKSVKQRMIRILTKKRKKKAE